MAADITADSLQRATPVRMTGPARGLLFPPPLAPGDQLPPREIAAAMRRNVLSAAFTARAFEEEVLTRRLFGHDAATLNVPTHPPCADRQPRQLSPAPRRQIRRLHPIIGRGLFLADGVEWREQRRAMRAGLRAAHDPGPGAPCRRRDRRSGRRTQGPSRRRYPAILEHMHRLAIEIAGRSMFSLGMQANSGRGCATCCTAIPNGSGRPTLPDVILPPAISYLARSRPLALPPALAGADCGDRRGAQGQAARSRAERPPRPDRPRFRQTPRDRPADLPRPARRPGRDDDRRRPRDDRDRAVLDALPARQRARGAAARRRRGGAGSISRRRAPPRLLRSSPIPAPSSASRCGSTPGLRGVPPGAPRRHGRRGGDPGRRGRS